MMIKLFISILAIAFFLGCNDQQKEQQSIQTQPVKQTIEKSIETVDSMHENGEDSSDFKKKNSLDNTEMQARELEQSVHKDAEMQQAQKIENSAKKKADIKKYFKEERQKYKAEIKERMKKMQPEEKEAYKKLLKEAKKEYLSELKQWKKEMKKAKKSGDTNRWQALEKEKPEFQLP